MLLLGLSGALGGQVVYKQWRGQTILSKLPDMSGIIPSAAQIKCREKFTRANEFAQKILKDPIASKAYKPKKHQSLQNCIVSVYMKAHGDE